MYKRILLFACKYEVMITALFCNELALGDLLEICKTQIR